MIEERNEAVSPYLVGPPVLRNAGFFGREEQIRVFFQNINREQMHCQRVLGARRSGKTSFLRHVADPEIYKHRIRTPGLPVLLAYVDLQAAISEPLLFFHAVASAIADAARNDEEIPVPSSFDDVRSFDIWLEPVWSRFRLVVLLDEFEILAQSDGFDLDFFSKLRALANGAHKKELVWATASYRDVATLSKVPGTKDLASPLYNIFHCEPIYLGPLASDEAESLVRNPAAKSGVSLATGDVDGIRELAGDMPFLLQAAADKWFLAYTRGIRSPERFTWVMNQLLSPGNLVREQFSSSWASLSLRAQRILKLLADGTAIADNADNHDTLLIMERFGFVLRRNGRLLPGGVMFQQWISNHSDTAPGVPRIFIGHGHSLLWMKVKDHVEKSLRMIPLAYESETHVGEAIVPILKTMLEQADLAIIVVTGEDKTAEGSIRPRQNVVHEVGLYQGYLDFHRTVLLMQDGVEFLSNLAGMQVISFKGDDIDSTFWPLSRVLRRENLLI